MADYVEDAEGPAVGIDLGTTYSCVAVYKNGHPKVIANDHGDRITPSCVSFSDGGLLVGNEARNRLTMQPTNTVYESKRLIGRTFDDPVIAKDIRRYPFDVVNDSGKPKFNVRHQGEAKTYYPEEISAMVLEKMKSVAESYLKMPVTKAVITVPAYFNETQRKATKDAARIAGLEVLRIINEPTAAAMAYGVNRQPGGDAERHVLVFDLGGGTFDVSVLVLDEGVFRVLATGGDTHLGGTDFDNRLVDKIINFFNKKQAVSEHATTNTMKREYHRLRNACEQAKCELSEFDFAKVQVEYFHNGQDLSYHLERSEFEALNQDLFDELMEHVKTTLADANLSTDDIDDVLLVGGSSRIPKIRERLQQLFHGKPLNAEINPDEAVACGAAIHAAILDGDESEELEDVMLQDITPLSLGINLKGDVTLPVVKRNSLVPCRYTKTVTTSEDDQTRIDMDVYQGERTHSRENHFLGEFHLDGIQPAPRSVPRIDVTFCIDADNCIEVTARDRFTLLEHTVKIEPNKAISSNEEISRLVQEATQHHQEDRAERERVTVRSALETRSHWVRHLTTTHSQTLQLSQQHLTIVNKVAQDITTWLYHNYENPTEEYKVQLHRLQKACESVGIPAECLVPGNVPGQTQLWSRRNQASWVDPAEDEAVPEVD